MRAPEAASDNRGYDANALCHDDLHYLWERCGRLPPGPGGDNATRLAGDILRLRYWGEGGRSGVIRRAPRPPLTSRGGGPREPPRVPRKGFIVGGAARGWPFFQALLLETKLLEPMGGATRSPGGAPPRPLQRVPARRRVASFMPPAGSAKRHRLGRSGRCLPNRGHRSGLDSSTTATDDPKTFLA